MHNIEEAVQALKRSSKFTLLNSLDHAAQPAKPDTFEKLGGVEDAEFSNAKRGPGCIPGTRISLLAMLLVWAVDPSSTHVF